MAEDIENFFENTKDEAKRIYELAEYIRCEYVECAEFKLIVNKENDNQRYADKLLDHLIYSVDCYEVAKALINRYKRRQGLSNRKNKKNLSLVKKSA